MPQLARAAVAACRVDRDDIRRSVDTLRDMLLPDGAAPVRGHYAPRRRVRSWRRELIARKRAPIT